MLFLAKLLQRFDITSADRGHELQLKHTLTMKPEGLFIHVRRRDVRIEAAGRTAVEHARQVEAPPAAAPNGVPVRVLYGSNAGTSRDFAQGHRCPTRGRRRRADLCPG